MSGIEGQNPKITFGTHKVELGKSDGVKKETVMGKENKNTMQSIFNKYDENNDGYLDNSELNKFYDDLNRAAGNGRMSKQEAKNLAQELGMDGLKRKDLQQFAETLANENDGVSAQWGTTEADKNTYTVVDGNKTTVKEFADDRHETLARETVKDGNTTTVTNYDNGVKTTKEVTVGSGDNITSRKVYTYDEDGNGPIKLEKYGPGGEALVQTQEIVDGKRVTTDFGANGKETQKTVEDGEGNEVVTTFEWAEDGSHTETTNGEVKSFDADGNEITGAPENPEVPESKQHAVQKGETWYNIVKEEYGVTDHKTIMEIVHQLKDLADPKKYGKEARYNSKSIPREITLPTNVTLANGQTVTLTNPPEAAAPEAAAAAQARAAGTPDATQATEATAPTQATEATAPTQATEATETTPAAPATRQLSGAVSGQYEISEDGVLDRSQLSAPAKNNEDYKAFTSGYGGSRVKLKGNKYIFRGVSSKTPHGLKKEVKQKAAEIAQETAVYRDLKAKQSGGETLSEAEDKFIQQYLAKLETSGLRYNEQTGKVEDITS